MVAGGDLLGPVVGGGVVLLLLGLAEAARDLGFKEGKGGNRHPVLSSQLSFDPSYLDAMAFPYNAFELHNGDP